MMERPAGEATSRGVSTVTTTAVDDSAQQMPTTTAYASQGGRRLDGGWTDA